MSNLCDLCKKNIAVIQMDGKRNFCFDCHNALMLAEYGENDTFQYPSEITVIDDYGERHTLKINHLILGDIVSWEANEVGGDYHFKDISELGDSGYLVASKFIHKITRGVRTKSIGPYGIKSKGAMQIVEDEDAPDGVAFVIDGKKFTPNEVAALFKGYPDFNVVFQIQDASRDLLDKDEYLVPVEISREKLIEDLNVTLAVTAINGFMSYKDVNKFDEMFYKIYDKLEVMKNVGDIDEVRSIARELASLLSSISSDDDAFPSDRIEAICKLVDPYHTDEMLWGYLDI